MSRYDGVLTYDACKRLMATARNKTNGKPLMQNTRLHEKKIKCGEHEVTMYTMSLYGHRLLGILPHGYVISDGGWRSSTTKMRLNKYLPDNYSVYQRKWIWYVRNSDNDKEIQFHNGSFLDWRGRMYIGKAFYPDKAYTSMFGQDDIDKLYYDWKERRAHFENVRGDWDE